MKLTRLTYTLLASLACSVAHAASVGNTLISSIIVTEGNAFIYPTAQLTGFAACATYGSTVNRLAINTTTGQGRAQLNAAQLALAMGKAVTLIGRKTIFQPSTPDAESCSVQAGDETLFFIEIKP